MTTVLIFTFVALWHDLSFRLLAWGWLVSLFILPELLATVLLPQSKVLLIFLRDSFDRFITLFSMGIMRGTDTSARAEAFSTSSQ